jgi:hypothetical protein
MTSGLLKQKAVMDLRWRWLRVAFARQIRRYIGADRGRFGIRILGFFGLHGCLALCRKDGDG